VPRGNGNLGQVERLLDEDPTLINARNLRDIDKPTPLIVAAESGHVDVVLCLLNRGAAVNARDGMEGTALYWPCLNGHGRVVRLLLERGADPTITDRNGFTPLFAAAVGGHEAIVQSLLQTPAIALIDQRCRQGQTALSRAVCTGREGVVRILLRHGADPTVGDNLGRTPLMLAKALKRQACVEALEVSACYD
jgi:uncharacterized protein